MWKDPTPQQIKDRCEQIQAWWSADDEFLRSRGIGRCGDRKEFPHLDYRVPEVKPFRNIRKSIENEIELFDSEYWQQGGDPF